jgi:acetyl esterase/lipase
VVVIPEYRLYPETLFPGFVEDVAQAVRWTHEHAQEFGADPHKIYVMGHSAGAHIASMINFDEQFLHAVGGGPQWIRGFIGLAGPYDFLPITDPILQQIFGPQTRYPLSQPINFVDGSEPPALLLHGRTDQVVWPRNSEHLAAKIREKGGTVTEKYYDDMSHTDIIAALSVYYRKRRTVLDDIEAFVAATHSNSL